MRSMLCAVMVVSVIASCGGTGKRPAESQEASDTWNLRSIYGLQKFADDNLQVGMELAEVEEIVARAGVRRLTVFHFGGRTEIIYGVETLFKNVLVVEFQRGTDGKSHVSKTSVCGPEKTSPDLSTER